MASTKVTVLAGLFGNTLEWYDFILYANFAPIFATLFFPAHDPSTSLLLTFAVFATGFIVRPFGAALFGYIGDHLGRKKALILSISLITLPTTLIGCIPTYETIGISAPIILTVLRILQGLAISGELNTAATYMIEHAEDNRRGLAGSLIMATAFLGMILGAIASFSVSNFSAYYDWYWRVPFWISGVLGLIGLVIRLQTAESPSFLKESRANEKHTALKEIFINYRKEVLITVFLTMVMAVGNYIIIAFVLTFLVKYQGMTFQAATTINMVSMLISLGLFPYAGLLSDQVGRKRVFKIGLWSLFVLSLPIFWLLSQQTFAYALLGDILLCAAMTPIAGLIPIMVAELFPTRVRNSGTAIGYNLSLALFGGTAPLIAIKLIQVTQSNYAPGLYLMFSIIISAITLRFIEEKHQQPLH